MSMGGGSSNAEYVQEQYEYDIEKYKLDWQDMQDAYNYAKEGFDIASFNQKAEIDFKNKSALNEWADKEAMRIFDYNNQIDAYNASKKSYRQQLEFNDMAQQMQMSDNTRKYNERLTDIGFQNEDLIMKLEFSQDAAKLKQRGVGLNFKNAMGDVGLSIAEGKEEANLSGQQLTQQLKRKKSEYAVKGQEQQIAALHAEGKVRNLGQSGRTATKNMQSVFANHARASAALTDLLVKDESQYNLDLTKVATKLQATERRGEHQVGMAKGQASLSYDQIATDLLQQVKTTDFSQRQLNESLKSAGAQWESDMHRGIMDRLNADFAAKDRLAPPPQLAPQLRPPIDLPYPKVQGPKEPMDWSRYQKLHPVKGVVQRGPSPFLGLFGSVASAFIAKSDDRFKYDINRVGTSPAGIPEYTFRYRLDGEHGPKYKGTSAQDLIAMGRLDAVAQKEKDGFYYVDYSKLDVEFEQVTAT